VRLLLLLLGLAVLVMIPFLLMGERFESRFSPAGARDWLADYGQAWGWLAALGLLIGDLVLPIPATGVMSALGYVYGTWIGGLTGAAGSFLSGVTAYELCRWGGQGAADRLLGPGDQARAERIFSGGLGGWMVALSRWMPLLPELTACMAGLTRMPRRRFLPALACGCVPMGLVFAAIGASGAERPGLAVGLSVLVPAVCYAATAWWLKRSRPAPEGGGNSRRKDLK
jgi:uncharacterized membrane protein YdjX (TVP38/TMEM64 family)